MVLWYYGSLVLWFSGTMVLWYYGSLVLWFSGTMVLWFSGTMVLWYSTEAPPLTMASVLSVMSSVRFRAVVAVALQLGGVAVSSSLYCGEVEGLWGVEAFMVELYRCKLCQFTCGLKASISSHLQVRHRPLTLTYLEEGGEGGGAEDREGASPYRFDLNAESKQRDEDEDFLLYNMLDSMSPPTCDISGEGGLQIAHTCEVSTLFEEESSMFPLKGGSGDLSCPIDPPATQEEMAQSAHLMTLGLCRISATKPPPPPSPRPPRPPPEDSPCLSEPGSLKESETGTRTGTRTGTPPCSGRRLPCPLCPAVLPSRRLLDVHLRSHRTAGGFSCVRCSWTADSWEELEPHWRRHCRRRRRREEQEQEKKKKKKKAAASRQYSCPVCLRKFRSAASRRSHTQTRHSDHSDGWRSRLIGRAGEKEAERLDSQTSRQPSEEEEERKEKKKKTTTTSREAEERRGKETGFFCPLCHRKFSTKLTLRRHLGTHGGARPHSCPTCPYRSRLKASLRQHLRTHTGERPHRCPQCPYASSDRSSLLRHSRTHSQEKPYGCERCDYRSIQKKSLDLHARRHHTGEAFPCQQCDYSSPDRQLLLRHVSRHHGDLTGDRAL
ncbi:zinc finger protein 668 isoform X2 [Pseudoliparis swirei]|uniref:zinc finger protein 668 isoform X2 n=1 Tax=Pseudoliparis swirei TaxID=2059687 RepID=UPI0024BEA559|nr:zinc finger protein 668 isoform X2 [Pseudoliparis swirei]